MQINTKQPSLGLALSGSGNRTTFYIGFLEVFEEANVPVDYIAACSGGSLVAAAYACGTLQEFKKFALGLSPESMKKFFIKGTKGGGLLSLEFAEEKLREFTKGLTFEEVRPLMSFVTVDIETGEQVNLCMGDIAKAALISCTLPGVFEPVKWGSKTLVDGGLLSQVPIDALKQFPVDITVGVNMRGTKHIFSEGQITIKRVLNFIGKILFFEEAGALVKYLLESGKQVDFEKNPNSYTVLTKSLNLAVEASRHEPPQPQCDLMIVPEILKKEKNGADLSNLEHFYLEGRKAAQEYVPKILQLKKQFVTVN